jgi:hypothetical protein
MTISLVRLPCSNSPITDAFCSAAPLLRGDALCSARMHRRGIAGWCWKAVEEPAARAARLSAAVTSAPTARAGWRTCYLRPHCRSWYRWISGTSLNLRLTLTSLPGGERIDSYCPSSRRTRLSTACAQ